MSVTVGGDSIVSEDLIIVREDRMVDRRGPYESGKKPHSKWIHGRLGRGLVFDDEIARTLW